MIYLIPYQLISNIVPSSNRIGLWHPIYNWKSLCDYDVVARANTALFDHDYMQTVTHHVVTAVSIRLSKEQ